MAALGPDPVGLPAADHPVRPDVGRRDGDVLRRAGAEHGRPGRRPLPAGHAIRRRGRTGDAGGGLLALGHAAGLRQPDPRVHGPDRHDADRRWPCSWRPLAADAADEAQAAGRSWGWRVPALLVACGFVTGWSFEVRETAIFAWPVIGWVLWRIGRPLRTLAWFAPPALAWLVLDMAAVRGGLRRPVAQVPDPPGGGHLPVGGQLGRRLRRAVPVVVRDDPAPVDPGGLRRAGPAGLPGRRARWAGSCSAPSWAGSGPGGCSRSVCCGSRAARWTPGIPSVRLDVARYWLSFIVPLMLAAVGTMVIVIRQLTRAPGGSAPLVGGAAAGPGGAGTGRAVRHVLPGVRAQRRRRDGRAARRPRLAGWRAGGRAGLGRLGHPAGAARLPDRPVRRPALGGGQLPIAQPAGAGSRRPRPPSTPSPGSTS